MRILLAEDDRMLNRALCYQLENLDFQVDSCLDGEDALFYGEQNIYDVILLDRMLPGMEGTEILTALRAKGISTPIIMITALGTLSDKVKGLDLGADDYLVKPFAFEELMARIRCVTRRSPILTASDPSKVCLEDLTLFLEEKCLKGPKGQCTLSQREAVLAEVLLRAGLNTPMPRTTLLLKVWGPDSDIEDGNLDNYIHFQAAGSGSLKAPCRLKPCVEPATAWPKPVKGTDTAMILQKVHLKLTLLCTGITTFIMLVMSLIYLHLSETQLFQNELYSFENDLHTMETNLEQQSIISMEWIAKMEAYGNYQLFLFDNGTPFLYNQLHDTPQNQKLLKKAQKAAEELELPTKKTSAVLNRMDSVLLNASRQENDLIGMVYSTGSDSSLQIFVFSSLSHLHYQYIEQRIFFVLITISATLLLFAFSYFFTKKLLKPIAENQEKQLQFVASASHELRTPLAVILSSAECCEYEASPDQHSFLRTIGEEGKRMSHLIDEMLYLSQSRDQQMRIHLEQVELDTLCLKVFESFEPLAARQGLTLSLDLPEHPISSVTGDEEKLTQLLGILLSNALSYTPEGGSITIRLKTQGRAHLISVEDTGIGIAKEDQAHIFDRFYRTEKSRSTKGHFGLGLSIAYEIVTAHGGKIEVGDNTPNGSIFTVTL